MTEKYAHCIYTNTLRATNTPTITHAEEPYTHSKIHKKTLTTETNPKELWLCS